MLGDMKFLDSLKTYDKDNIPAATIKKIRDKYVPMASFNAKEVAKVSSGAFSFIKISTDHRKDQTGLSKGF